MFITNRSALPLRKPMVSHAPSRTSVQFKGETDLHKAVEEDDFPDVQDLLSRWSASLSKDAFQKAIDEPDDDGDSALHTAARRGIYKIVEKLLSVGARTDLTNKQNITPQEVAKEYNNLEVEKLLDCHRKRVFNFQTAVWE